MPLPQKNTQNPLLSALAMMQMGSATPQSTRVDIPSERKYGGVTFPQGMSKEEQAMLFAMVDSLRMNDYNRAMNISYNTLGKDEDGFQINGSYSPFTNNIKLQMDGTPAERANRLSHELLHASSNNVLGKELSRQYDRQIDSSKYQFRLNDFLGLEHGSTEPLAYGMSNGNVDSLNADPNYQQYKSTIQKNVDANNSILTALARLFLPNGRNQEK